MVSRCANPSCSALFKYLHSGRIFQFEAAPETKAATRPGRHNAERFWLCSQCSKQFSLVAGPDGVLLISLPPKKAAVKLERYQVA